MSRKRDPARDEARKIWLESDKKKPLKDIADQLGKKPSQIRKWKSMDDWNGKSSVPQKVHSKRNVTNGQKERSQSKMLDDLFKDGELTDKQKLFCLYYLQRFNATWAYQKAYEADYHTANRLGPRMMVNDGIKSAIGKLRKQQQSELYMNANDVLKQYIHQATASLGDVINYDSYEEVVTDDDGKPKFDQNNRLERYHRVDIHLKPADEVDWSLIEDVHVGRDGLVVKLYDKQKAMKELLDRLPEPEETDSTDDAFLNAIYNAKRENDDDD